MTKKQKPHHEPPGLLPPKAPEPELIDVTGPLQSPGVPPAEATELPLATRIAPTPAGEVALVIKGGIFGPEEKWLAWKPLEGYRVAFLILGQSAQLLGQPAPLE